ncbi:MAG: hypothetical protein M3N54_11585 [Acidobacteriota bacterium]|nr:hypothetical protein [Acidobacteriota bacterium]
MPFRVILVALVTGSVAILLGLWSGLDRLVDELRSMTALGMMQPVVPNRTRTTVSRQQRMFFIAFGAVVILLSFYATFFKR